jgi:hypothetical protein
MKRGFGCRQAEFGQRLKERQPFNPEVFAREEQKMKRQKLARLQNMAASLNYQLVPPIMKPNPSPG